jgi:hypothetical protein
MLMNDKSFITTLQYGQVHKFERFIIQIYCCSTGKAILLNEKSSTSALLSD